MSRSSALTAVAVVLAAASVFGWQRHDTSAGASAGEAAAAASPTPSTPPSAAEGATVFRTKGCASCHVARGTTPQYQLGFPDLTEAATWAGTRRPGRSAADYVRESVRDPNAFLSPAFRGGAPSPMPSLALTDAELDAVVAYLLGT